MANQHQIHENHPHQHGPNCGHTPINHQGHTDYIHDGHLHFRHESHLDEHRLEISAANPANCTKGHDCSAHNAEHKHGKNCGHEAIPHGDHVDYVVAGHLHHPHDGHCDNHGKVQLVN